MHELSIADSVLEMILKEAQQHAFAHVQSITLRIGTVAGIEIDLLKRYLPMVFENTVADNADIIIEHVAAEAICNHCQQQSTLQSLHQSCPHCDTFQWQWLCGKDIQIKDLLVTC